MRSPLMPLLGCLIILVFLVIGCSSRNNNPVSGNPLTPEVQEIQKITDLPLDTVTEGEGHELMGSWTMTYDPQTQKVTIEPNRETLTHYNVKSFLPNPGLHLNSYDPVREELDVDVTVRNPYGISGYDVRVIIYTDAVGHTLNNEDNWTALYDIPGGMPINPFKAYAKTETNRLFARGSSHTENLKIKMPGGNFNVKFAIDASYPANCEEPYMIGNLTQEEVFYDRKFARAAVHVELYCWPNLHDPKVLVRCPEIFGDGDLQLDTDDNMYFYGNLSNREDAPAGEYTAILIASNVTAPIELYSIDTIYVTEKPIYGWAKQFTNDDYVTGVENDESGDIYVSLRSTSTVAKYTKEKTQVWAHDLNNDGPYGQIQDLSYDPTLDYVYTTGYYYYCGTTNFSGMSMARLNKSTANTHSVYQCFTTPVGPWDVCNDTAGNTYNTGVYGGDSDPAPIMWKVNTGMGTSWINIFEDSQGSMEFEDLCSSSFSTIYAVGQFWGSMVDLDPADDVEYNVIPLGYHDAILSEWNSAGQYVKFRYWGGYNDTSASAFANVVGEDNDDNIIVAGQFLGTVDFNPTGTVTAKTSQARLYDMYISKFNSSMTFQKCVQISGTEEIMPLGVDFDIYNNVYICGYYEQTVDFNPGSGVAERTAVGNSDIFVAKYDSNLNLVWVQTWGSTGYDVARDLSYETVYNQLYVCGYFDGTIDFDPGENVSELTATDMNGFLMRLVPSTGTWEY